VAACRSKATTVANLVAILLETRAHPRLPALLAEARANLPRGAVVLVLGTERALRSCGEVCSGVHLLRLPLDPPAKFVSADCSRFWTRPELYANVRARFVMSLQTDGMLCAPVQPFLDSGHEWIGAPWSRRWHRRSTRAAATGGEDRHGGGNGGISLRLASACSRVLARKRYVGPEPEDVWFLLSGIRCAPLEVCAAFACEQVCLTATPAALHAPWKALSDADLSALERQGCPGVASLLRDNGVAPGPLLRAAEASGLARGTAAETAPPAKCRERSPDRTVRSPARSCVSCRAPTAGAPCSSAAGGVTPRGRGALTSPGAALLGRSAVASSSGARKTRSTQLTTTAKASS